MALEHISTNVEATANLPMGEVYNQIRRVGKFGDSSVQKYLIASPGPIKLSNILLSGCRICAGARSELLLAVALQAISI